MDRKSKYHQYIDMGWWKNVTKRDLDSWINNFDNEDLAYTILDFIIFYTSEQLDKYADCLINQLKDEVYLNSLPEHKFEFFSDDEMEKKWNSFKESFFVAPAKLVGDVVSSANNVARQWRNRIGESKLINIEQIPEHIKEGQCFILVDDFSGTGKQMIEVLSQTFCIQENNIELGRIPEVFSNIQLKIALYVIHENAYKKIKETYPYVEIMYIDYLDKNTEFFGDISNHDDIELDLDKLKYELNNIHESIYRENEDYQKIQEFSLNVPIVFEHGCPNNAMLVLFAKSNTWKQLFKRGDE